MRQRYLQSVALLALAVPLSLSAADPRLDEAAREAARAHDAKVLSARTIKRPGGQTDQIKMLTRKGVVKTIQVPRYNLAPGNSAAPRNNPPPRNSLTPRNNQFSRGNQVPGTNQAPNQGQKKDR